jgi:two-component system, OmpR family, phosphate regulon sensor histidine kinase PhoR
LVAGMEGRSRQKNIELIFEDNDQIELTAYGDKERLAQVLTNLIDNGIKYNKEFGKVFVSLHAFNNDCIVTIQDTGIGLAKEHIDRIFERFYRVDKQRSRDVGGTGLGLAIVKHILEAHKSTIKVESTLGAGTRISFTLKKSDN